MVFLSITHDYAFHGTGLTAHLLLCLFSSLYFYLLVTRARPITRLTFESYHVVSVVCQLVEVLVNSAERLLVTLFDNVPHAKAAAAEEDFICI